MNVAFSLLNFVVNLIFIKKKTRGIYLLMIGGFEKQIGQRILVLE